ncbi:MAG: Nudix family hydrolase [Abyssibacter sp.]|uniref:Nudix family hydrolase n=1 Tax=Abyssibacter sp. TaxID=2320200 RepID=UPI003218E6ED
MLHIAVGIVQRGQQVLISQRLAGKPGAGQWEFPGGKLEQGERVTRALRRELDEELGIQILDHQPLMRLVHHYPDRTVLLDTWRVRHWSGEPRGCEGQAIRWCPVDDLAQAGLLAADRPLIAALQWPACYGFTPDDWSASDVLAALPRLTQDAGLIRLRLPRVSDAEYRALVMRLIEQGGLRIAVDRPDIDWASVVSAEQRLALHLPGYAVATAGSAPPDWARGGCIVSSHDPQTCVQAREWGAQALVLGTARSTPSHPDQPPAGWAGLRTLADAAGLPCYAIGGLTPRDLAVARWSGCFGVAGIRGFWPQLR